MSKRLSSCVRAALIGVAILVTGPATASTTHYFYDAAGRFIGSTATSAGIRSNRYDAADNRSLWQSGACAANTSSQQLFNSQCLFQGQALVSGNGVYVFQVQEDGNAVIVHGSSAIWSTSTGNTTGATLDMQGDGNLVLYDAQYKPLWQSNTAGNANASLVMQSDGNLVIYSSSGVGLWSSNTVGK